VSRPDAPPALGTAERDAPVGHSHAWEEQGHEEAEAAREGRHGAPPEALPGTGAGGGEAPRVGGS